MSASEKTITLPYPHPGQARVREEMRRFNVLSAGRRWRKTTFGMAWVVEETLRAGGDYLWGAPTFKQVRVGWDELRRATSGVVEFNESRMTALYPNGATGYYVSLDNPDNARGLTAFRAVLDEAADISARGWREVVRPMLMDTNGSATLMGTPDGRNWFWEEFIRAQERGVDSRAWQIPTLGARIVNGALERQPHPYENPSVPWPELEQMFETLPERVFRQEILAEFLDDAGGVFRGVRECVSGMLDPNARPRDWAQRFVIGVDLAKYQDYTVCVVVDVETRRVVGFDRYNKADWTLQKERIAQLARYWNNAQVWMDATGLGDPIYDDLHRAGLNVMPYKFTAATKSALINNAVLMVEQRSVSFPEIPALVNELIAYEYQRSEGGMLRMNAPEGFNDDAVCAFALACWPLQHGVAAGGQLSQAQLSRLLIPGGDQMIGGVRIMRKEF